MAILIFLNPLAMCAQHTPMHLRLHSSNRYSPLGPQSHINTIIAHPYITNIPLYLSPFSLTPLLRPPLLSYPHFLSMNTRAKNKSKHPAAPVMTPAQLAAAGISQPQKRPARKQTKAQQIAALEEDLRVTQELLQVVSYACRSHYFPGR